MYMLIHDKTEQEEKGPKLISTNFHPLKVRAKEKDLTRYNEKEKIKKENWAQ